MKRFVSLILLLVCLFLFTGCDTYNPNEDSQTGLDYSDLQDAEYEGYQSGYDSGYSDGYADGRSDTRRDAYNEGFSDAIRGAENYASNNSEWHPEEALAIVDAYSKQEPLLDGKVPSKTEYQEAVETLGLFYEYFYGVHFKTK